MVQTWLDMIEVNMLDWDRSKRIAGHDMRRLLSEVERLRKVIQACDTATELDKIRAIIHADRQTHSY